MNLVPPIPSMHDALAPAGPQAARIAELWWILFWASTGVTILILCALAWALWRAPRASAGTPPAKPAPESERRAARSVAAALAISSVLLVGLLAASIVTDRALARLPLAGAVNLHVTAHRWWWDVTYDDADPTRVFRTANEIHVPVGRPVIVTLDAVDVIHSFWVPSLAGKKDLIPGRTSTLEFRADVPGRYHGMCAEFCGWQHANMAFDVVADPPADFDRWAEAQRKPAEDPTGEAEKRGRTLFMSGSCMMCHEIRGTTAGGRKAPDLTHVASRPRLAGGAVANVPYDLATWIIDPQKAKPGADMPSHPLPADDIDALVAYLGTLR